MPIPKSEIHNTDFLDVENKIREQYRQENPDWSDKVIGGAKKLWKAINYQNPNVIGGAGLLAFVQPTSLSTAAGEMLALGKQAKVNNTVAKIKRATNTGKQEVIWRHPKNPGVCIIKNETEGGPGGQGFFTAHLDPGTQTATVPISQLKDLANEIEKLEPGSVISANGMSLDGIKALVNRSKRPNMALAQFEGESLPILENFGTEVGANIVGNPAVDPVWRLEKFNNFADRIGIDRISNIEQVPWFGLIKLKKHGGFLPRAKSGIHIKPKNKGKFTETKKRTGKTTEELTHSKNPLTRKRAIFAQNAKKWNHKDK